MPINRSQIQQDKIIVFSTYDSSKSIYFTTKNKYDRFENILPNMPYITTLQYQPFSLKKSDFEYFDFFLQEGLESNWFGDVELIQDSYRFKNGINVYATKEVHPGDLIFDDHGEYELLRWKYDQRQYLNRFTAIDYFSFVDKVSQIPEFRKEKYIEELTIVPAQNGVFLEYEDKGIACISLIGKHFLYVSYIGLIPTARKTHHSSQILESLFAIANKMKKDLVVAVTEPKIKPFYLRHGFVSCGFWREVK